MFLNWVKKWQTLIKLVLFISITSLAIVEITRLFKTISFDKIGAILRELSPIKVIGLALLGSMAVAPMMLYDRILNKELNQKQKLSYLLETSWTINSLNNMIGFASLVDVGLRYSFYGDEERSEKSMQGISRVIPYFMSGFSMFALISLIFTIIFPISMGIKQYWSALLGACLYLPIILFVSNRKKWVYFGQLSGRTILSLVLTSALDWASVLSFFLLVGYVLGYNLPIYDVIPLFMIAITIGIISMIPGSLGSFDLIMISGLVGLGLDKAQALSWLLVFRLFYYILPFCLGVVLFLKNMGGRLNEKYLGIPQKVIEALSSIVLVWGLRLFGFFLIVSAIVPQELGHLPLLKELSPSTGQFVFQLPSIVFGVLFFLLARLVRRRLKFTLMLANVLSVTSLIYLNIGSFSLISSIFLIKLLSLIWWKKDTFVRRHYIYAWEDCCKDIIYIGGTLFLTLLLLGHLNPHHVFKLKHLSHLVTHWIHLLGLSLILVMLYILVLRESNQTKENFGEVFDKQRYQDFIATIPNINLDAALAYLDDKYLYWYQEDGQDKVVFQFAIDNNKCVVMSDPLAQSGYLEKGLSKFLEDAEDTNVSVIFYEINQEITLLLHEYGYDFMKFGETAQVLLDRFTTEGKQGKKFRTVVNRLESKGYQFQVLQPPFDKKLLNTLKEISDNWLDGRQEKGFSLGFFDEKYIQLAPIALVRDKEDKVQAFVTFLACNGPEEASIDLMRYHLRTAPNGIMDYLFVKLLLHFKEEGVSLFELGMAPLSNVGTEKHSFLQEKVAYLIYAFTNRFYSFSGLRQYKQKFNPIWTPRYVAYPRDTWLILDMLAIYRVDNRKVKRLSY
ncbi:bifunctional lysylphosphatidylglycerol flippase/synthetase MprF [Streptococcus mitis]|uniref:bifunctional lysylphosphatidylglycerol flippase/synthetase MprF n=1 Tax=Streptococcus mitis TaxID=28037 RepID=UPI0001E5483B|nr:bifunctional lysylphosphatidylglycerol flippase/synthetase MprF [Streptococcus mitis]EFN96536.1 putative lysylphosphatidylglycerol synthetase [Streptococcus mitis SK321]